MADKYGMQKVLGNVSAGYKNSLCVLILIANSSDILRRLVTLVVKVLCLILIKINLQIKSEIIKIFYHTFLAETLPAEFSIEI